MAGDQSNEAALDSLYDHDLSHLPKTSAADSVAMEVDELRGYVVGEPDAVGRKEKVVVAVMHLLCMDCQYQRLAATTANLLRCVRITR